MLVNFWKKENRHIFQDFRFKDGVFCFLLFSKIY